MDDRWLIQSEQEIEELIGKPSPVVQQKIFDHVDEFAAAFIARSPLLLLATSSASGRLEVRRKAMRQASSCSRTHARCCCPSDRGTSSRSASATSSPIRRSR